MVDLYAWIGGCLGLLCLGLGSILYYIEADFIKHLQDEKDDFGR